MFATQVLPGDLSDDSVEESNSQVVGLIVVDEKEYEVKKGETRIGRDSSVCSIVIENFTISKVHAVIESEGIDDTFIYDVGSTNQTKLGKKILKPHCRYKLDNDSRITLGNVTAKFVIQPDRSSDCNSQTDKPGNFDALNDLEDIFDIPTQVSVVPANTSSKLSKFEKLPENFHVFKIPRSVSPAETSRSSKSRFDEDTQGKSDSQHTKERTVYYPDSLENSGIFSLGTQCQLYEPAVEEKDKCELKIVTSDENNKNSESDKINLLLNDGQDDVLCTFMSMHSPNEQTGVVKEIKVKTEIEGLTQVFDAVTQAQVEEIEGKERNESREVLRNKDFVEDFPTAGKPTTTSTPLSNKFVHPGSVSKINELSTQHTDDEDLIQTQQFNVDCLESSRQAEGVDSPSRDAETQPYLGDTLDELNTSREGNDEDLILTQSFEVVGKNQKATPMVVPESEDPTADKEDFMETQIFTFEKEIRGEGRARPETPERDADVINCTQRNDDDDFIATQVFEEGTDARNSDRNGSDDDEDFIATQKVEFPVPSGTKNCEETRTASRESSPDLLGTDAFSKNSEDCISTQIFEPPCHNPVQAMTEMPERPSSPCRTEKSDCNIAQVPDPAESSGDETESDLEIILETTAKDGGGGGDQMTIKCEPPEESQRALENDNSNSSYVFEVQPDTVEQNQVASVSDSDATDCEEIGMISPKIPVKQEPQERIEFEETQVLTLTLPSDHVERTPRSNDVWMTGDESPRFGAESPLSLEMPNTQDIETTMNRILQRDCNKEDSDRTTEVGITNGNVTSGKVEPSGILMDSPLKRPHESSNGEVVPIKKCKTEGSDRLLRNSEKQFSKLVQAHDIAQIQPSRTRNSLKSVSRENKTEVRLLGCNVNNERPPSRRKANGKRGNTKNPNGDITPYLTRKVEKRLSNVGRRKESPPKENKSPEGSTRVLRSSVRNATPAIPSHPPTRTSRRNSKAKNEDYFGSSCVSVVFTGFDCQILEKIISDLGGKRTNDLSSGEVVVADKVRRTVKFLSGVGLGLPIASPEWLLACKKEKKFVNPWDFILKDEESEERWSFELKASLEKSKKAKLLKGFSVFATRSTKPPVKDLLGIVQFCGGTPLFDLPDVWPKKTIVVSCLEDKKWWPPAKCRNVKIVHYEFILSGVLRQKIDFKTYQLR